jgi:hypothetical protein
MKRVVFILITLLLITNVTFSQSGWFWQNPLPQGNTLNSVKFVNISTGYSAGGYGTVIKTVNSGLNWTLLRTASTDNIKSIYFLDANTGFASGGASIQKTTNGGLNWSVTYEVFGGYGTAISIFFANSNMGWFTASSGKIFRTTNGGSNWIMEFPGLAINVYSLFAVNSDTCFITSTNGAILRCTNGFISVNSEEKIVPKKFALYQNYPNPFNPTTKIKFDLPSVGQRHAFDLRLIVYDILGREVAMLVDEQLRPGSYEVTWDASNYPSGVYFYKLITDEFVETRKMVLIK